MPVDFETHEPGDPRVDLSDGTNARRLVEFPFANPGVGYTPAELAEEAGISGLRVANGVVYPAHAVTVDRT